MSQNTCFPSLKCLNRSKSSANTKLKPPLHMPTVKDFIHKQNDAGTQTSICEGITGKSSETSVTYSNKSVTPLNHRSTIAIKNAGSFIPLSNSESANSLNKAASNQSFISVVKCPENKDNTVFLSNGNFFEIFENLRKKNSQVSSDVKKDDSVHGLAAANPFVLGSLQKPRIVPVTPAARRRNNVCRNLPKNWYLPCLSDRSSESNRSSNII